jgi:hypothetical protein
MFAGGARDDCSDDDCSDEVRFHSQAGLMTDF